MNVSAEDLRYPIGRFDAARRVEAAERPALIDSIASAPARFRAAAEGLEDDRLDTPYRPGGWTVRQLIHHVPDSHMNAYVRFKWTLTEDTPTIKTYDQAAWAELGDTRETPVGFSLALLESLHARWVMLLRGLSDSDWDRRLNHPEWGVIGLPTMLALYAWHGEHHTAHVMGLRKRMGW